MYMHIFTYAHICIYTYTHVHQWSLRQWFRGKCHTASRTCAGHLQLRADKLATAGISFGWRPRTLPVCVRKRAKFRDKEWKGFECGKYAYMRVRVYARVCVSVRVCVFMCVCVCVCASVCVSLGDKNIFMGVDWHIHPFMYAYTRSYKKKSMHTHAHTYERTHPHKQTHAYPHTSAHIHTCMKKRAHTHTHTHIHVYTHISIYIMHVCIYISICIVCVHIYRDTDKRTCIHTNTLCNKCSHVHTHT